MTPNAMPAAGATETRSTVDSANVNPFPGLRPFEESEARLFFGRESHIEALLKRLKRQRFVAVMGNSGSGKSSLVFAGVLPRIHRGYAGLAGSCWRVARMRPGSNPMGNLADALQIVREREDEDDYLPLSHRTDREPSALQRDLLRAELERSPESLATAGLNMGLDDDENLLVIVDQFEELFRFRALQNHNEAAAFVRLLLRASEQQTCPIYVVLTMRSDFLGECVRFPGLAEALNEGQYLVPLLTRDQRAQAICGPVALAGANISTALVQRLLNDAGDCSDDQLPVLQHALMRTFDLAANENTAPSNHGVRLELSHYLEAGGINSALSRHADEAYHEIEEVSGSAGTRTTELLFRCLTDCGEHGQGVRRPCKVSEVLAVTGAELSTLGRIVAQFVGKHRGFLVQQPPGPLTPETTLDISHESLMRKWGKLTEWTAAEFDFRRRLKSLDEAQREYANRKRSLLHNPELGLAVKWKKDQRPTSAAAMRYMVDLPAIEGFLRKSERGNLLQKVRLWLPVFLVLVLLGNYLYSELEVSRAEARLASAEVARAKVVRVAEDVGEGSILAAVYLREVGKLAPGGSSAWDETAVRVARHFGSLSLKARAESGTVTFGANEKTDDENVRAAAERGGRANVAASSPPDARQVERARTPRTESEKARALVGNQRRGRRRAAVSAKPGGRQVVTGFLDGTVRVWNSERGKLASELRGHTDAVNTASFSLDGQWVLTSSDDKTARVWDGGNRWESVALKGHTAAVNSASFSTDGQWVVTASDDGSARVWAREKGWESIELKGHTGAVNVANFSGDGRWVLTASDDKTARIWDSESGRLLVVLEGHNGAIGTASFSSDGKWVLTASDDKTARIWDSESGRLLVALEGHSGAINAASLSSDGKWVLTASDDKTARVWDRESGRLLDVLRGHAGAIKAANFSSDGKWVLTASDDKTARVWDRESGWLLAELEGHTESVGAATFSMDGKWLVTLSIDGEGRIWDSAMLQAELAGHAAVINGMSLDVDGTRVVTASSDGTARVWDRESGRVLAELRGHTNEVGSPTFSHDGRRVLTASSDMTVRVWDSESGKPIATLVGHTGPVRAATFSPDGKRIVTASHDQTARLWDSESGKLIATFEGHTGPVRAATFSPDGKRVVTASFDRTARVWDSESGNLEETLEGHTGRLGTASFSADGRWIITASEDGTARVWDREKGWASTRLDGHKGAVNAASFSADGKWVVTASVDKTARVWDREKNWAWTPLEGHKGAVYAASFSADGKWVVTASSDETARLWDREKNWASTPLKGHTGAVYAAGFSPDGKRIVTASSDFSAGVWAADGQALRFLGRSRAHLRAVMHERRGQQVAEVWDPTALVWRDARTVFWRELDMCEPTEERVKQLGETWEAAFAGSERCQKTVKACHNTTFDDCDSAVTDRFPSPQ